MMHRRSFLFLGSALAAAPSLLGAPALAVGVHDSLPFDDAAFARAQAEDALILVEISAPWCPMCKAQKEIIGALRTQERFADLVVFEIDFDTRKDLMRRFGAQLQSTLIVFRGQNETGRSVGEAQSEWIEAMLESGL